MRTADFDYHLPPELIAQTAMQPRDAARLLVLKRSAASIEHTLFHQLIHYLNPGDVLVLNQTKVLPARLFAHKIPSGGKVEILLLKREAQPNDAQQETWQALLGGNNMREKQIVQIEQGPRAQLIETLYGGQFRMRFEQPITPLLPQIGLMPLPPYIKTYPKNPQDYQTVYAEELGSAAAPTAGLHFTPELLTQIKNKGIHIEKITLHVGLDTFLPVHEDDVSAHKIHTEWCTIPITTVEQLGEAKRTQHKIIAVGTTTVRALETLAQVHPTAPLSQGFEGTTNLFILPGHSFQIIDAIITNFHLPKSTLLMLVSAFAGRERIHETYETAKQEAYRFFSFGDAMLIL